MSDGVLALCDGSSQPASQTATSFAMQLAAEARLPVHLAFTSAPQWEDRGWAGAWRIGAEDGRGVAQALTGLMSLRSFAAIVAGDAPIFRETLGRLAGALKLPVAGHVLSATVTGEHVEVVRAVDEGRRSAKYRLEALPALLLLDPEATAPMSAAVGRYVEGEAISVETRPLPQPVDERSLTPLEIAPQEADTLVAGGRGLGEDGFRLAEELAALLGGAVAASRVAVDLGWAPKSCQVGMTGQVVQPRLYIAAGISGAVHHVFGMKDSGFIVAINSDPGAPIFQFADAAIVGDAREVLAAMIEALKRTRSGSEAHGAALVGSVA